MHMGMGPIGSIYRTHTKSLRPYFDNKQLFRVISHAIHVMHNGSLRALRARGDYIINTIQFKYKHGHKSYRQHVWDSH